MGGSGKKLGLEREARVHQKVGGEEHSRRRGERMQKHGGCNSEVLFGLASFWSFRHQLKCNLNMAFSTTYPKRTLPPVLGSISFLEFIYYFTFFCLLSTSLVLTLLKINPISLRTLSFSQSLASRTYMKTYFSRCSVNAVEWINE